ncbi:hypothetical protein N9891_01705 [bacterium]|nr:hypothetical protein [bacterium]
MSSSSEIICRPTKWFIWRALLMVVMFGGFAGYFLYDWKIGYPKKNYIVANYAAFNEAGQAWTVDENRANWKAFVAGQKIPFQDEEGIYPPGTDLEEKWPAILATMSGNGNDEELWKEYSGEKGWPQVVDPQEDFMPAYKIGHQLIASAVCFLLTAVALFFLIRTKGRVMKADEKGYYPPGGDLIPYGDIKVLDKRKWESKGLATLTYSSDGEEKKAKIDGMVYGQFKEEEGAPAEALFQLVLSNFEGELIELVIEDDDDEESVEEAVVGDSDVENGEAPELAEEKD